MLLWQINTTCSFMLVCEQKLVGFRLPSSSASSHQTCSTSYFIKACRLPLTMPFLGMTFAFVQVRPRVCSGPTSHDFTVNHVKTNTQMCCDENAISDLISLFATVLRLYPVVFHARGTCCLCDSYTLTYFTNTSEDARLQYHKSTSLHYEMIKL